MGLDAGSRDMGGGGDAWGWTRGGVGGEAQGGT